MIDKEKILYYHRKAHGKTEIISRVLVEGKEDLSTYYTPGVSFVSDEIGKDPDKVYDYTTKSNTIAIISDCTRVLGLGDIGPKAGMPVMEGKAVLFKKFGAVDAIPICIDTKDEAEIIRLVRQIAPPFGGINLEDIESPKSFRIYQQLSKELDIPILHDDRQGTSVVVLAALINAIKLAKKNKDARIVVNGAGSAGFGITMQLVNSGFNNVIVLDKKGAIYKGREKDMNGFKAEIADFTNHEGKDGWIEDVVRDADVLIGASAGGAFKKDYITLMHEKPIVFALANPQPEISYEEAKNAGAYIVATGRSDMPNQVNNLLAFPGIMRGLLDCRAKRVTYRMLHHASLAIAKSVGKKLDPEFIIPTTLDREFAMKVIPKIAASVAEAAVTEKLARHNISYTEAKAKASRMIKRYHRIEKSTRRYMVGFEE